MNRFAFTDIRLHRDGAWHDALCVLIDGDRIAAIGPANTVPADTPQRACGGATLAAGFIDTQVNGGGGVMLNDGPSAATIDTMVRGHWGGGTTAMLPTLITDSAAAMRAAVEAVAARLQPDSGVLGIHLEGPHISPRRPGVHSLDHIRPWETATEALLAAIDPARYLLTVAPECLPSGTIARLRARGAHVSAGHTAASCAQIEAALAEGLDAFTHLYNAMTPITAREPGAVGACLADPHSAMGIIVDGHHLHPTTARLAIATKATGKSLLVTDAMATVGADSPRFQLYGETIEAIGGRCARADGALAGSALDMIGAVRNSVTDLGIALDEALRMASLYPARFLGEDSRRGAIEPGLRADLVLIDSELQLRETWVGGVCRYRRT